MNVHADTISDLIESEVHRHHRALQDWFVGDTEIASFDSTISSALHDNFEWVRPTGEEASRAKVLDWIRNRHGQYPGGSVTIQDFQLVADEGNIAVAKYTEVNFEPPSQAPSVTRRATAVFMIEPRLQWLHLFETQIY